MFQAAGRKYAARNTPCRTVISCDTRDLLTRRPSHNRSSCAQYLNVRLDTVGHEARRISRPICDWSTRRRVRDEVFFWMDCYPKLFSRTNLWYLDDSLWNGLSCLTISYYSGYPERLEIWQRRLSIATRTHALNMEFFPSYPDIMMSFRRLFSPFHFKYIIIFVIKNFANKKQNLGSRVPCWVRWYDASSTVQRSLRSSLARNDVSPAYYGDLKDQSLRSL